MLPILRHELVLNHRIEGAQEIVMPHKDVRLSAYVSLATAIDLELIPSLTKCIEHASQFDGNVPSTDYSHLLRLLVKLEESVGSDPQF